MEELKEIGLGILSLTITALQVILLGAAAGVTLFQRIGLQASKIGAHLVVAMLPGVSLSGTTVVGYGGIILLLAILTSVYIHGRFGL